MSNDPMIDQVYTLKDVLAEDALAKVYSAEVDLDAFDYNLLYAYTQVQGDSHVERVRAAGEYAKRLADKRLDPSTIRTILDTHDMPLPQQEAALLVAADGVDIEHFQQEWRNLLFLNHPNLVKVYGGGLWEGHPYCVMERLPAPLAPEIAHEALSLSEKLAVFAQAGQGVAHLHEKGLVHWDLRPENILILPQDGEGYLGKVTALGLTRGIDDLLGKASAGEVLESLCCMAPELVRGHDDGGACSDIYSLGACLYLSLTGHLPYHRKTRLFEIFESLRVGEAPQPAKELAPDLPEGAARILDKAMAPDPANRYASMAEMVVDLQALSRDPEAAIAAPVVAPIPTVQSQPPQPDAPAAQPTPVVPVPTEVPTDAAAPTMQQEESVAEAMAEPVSDVLDVEATELADAPAPQAGVTPAEESFVQSEIPQETAPPPAPLVQTPLVSEDDLAADASTTPPPTVLATRAPSASKGGLIALLAVLGVFVIGGGGGAAYYYYKYVLHGDIPAALRSEGEASDDPDTPEATPPAFVTAEPVADAPAPSGTGDLPPTQPVQPPTQPTEDAGKRSVVDAAEIPGTGDIPDEVEIPEAVPVPDMPSLTAENPTTPADGDEMVDPVDPVTPVDATETPEAASTHDPAYIRLMELAQNAKRRKEYDAVLKHASEAMQIEATPEATAMVEIAKIKKRYVQTRDEAVEKGRALLAEKKWSEAEQAVQRALEIEDFTSDEEALAVLEAARKGRYDEAIAAADAQLAAGEFDAAEMSYMQAMTIDGYVNDPRAIEGQQKSFQAKMDAAENVDAKTRAGRERAAKFEISMEEGRKLMAERKWMQAVQVFDTALSIPGYETNLEAMAARDKSALMSQQDPTHLKDQFDQYIARGKALLEAKQPEDAIESFRSAMRIEGFANHPEALAGVEEAKALRNTALGQTPARLFEEAYVRGTTLAQAGQLQEAAAAFSEALRVPGYESDPRAAQALASVQSQVVSQQDAMTFENFEVELAKVASDPAKIALLYDEAVRKRPTDVALQVRRIDALADAGRFNEARTAAATLTAQAPGNAWGAVALGMIDSRDGRYAQALESFQKAEAINTPADAVAAARAGMGAILCYSGRAGEFKPGVPQDNEKAYNYFKAAAQAGDPAGMNNLGYAYAEGRGVRRNKDEASIWFSRAAREGNPFGQFNYALALEQGDGLQKDAVNAATWYEKAVAQGIPRAAARLSEMYRQGSGVAQDEARAQELALLSAGASRRDTSYMLVETVDTLPPLSNSAPAKTSPAPLSIPALESRTAMPDATAQQKYLAILEEGQTLLSQAKIEEARQVFLLALRVPGYENDLVAKQNLAMVDQLLLASGISKPATPTTPETVTPQVQRPPVTPAVPQPEERVSEIPSGKSPQQAQYETMMAEARRLIIDQKWDDAIEVFQQTMNVPGYENNVAARNGIRMAQEAKAVGIAASRPGYSLTPEEEKRQNFIAVMRKANEMLVAKQWTVATSLFESALAMPGYKNDPNALEGKRAAAEGLRKEHESALKPVEIEMDMRDTATYTVIMEEAKRQFQAGKYEGAEQLFKMALELEGFNGDEAAMRGMLEAQQLKGSGMLPPKPPADPGPDAMRPPTEEPVTPAVNPLGTVVEEEVVTVTPSPPTEKPMDRLLAGVPDLPDASRTVVENTTQVGPPVPSAMTTPSPEAQLQFRTLMVEASRQLSSGNYDEAVRAYRMALQTPGFEQDEMALAGLQASSEQSARTDRRETIGLEEEGSPLSSSEFNLIDDGAAGEVRVRDHEATTRMEVIINEGENLLREGRFEAADEVFTLALSLPGYEGDERARAGRRAALTALGRPVPEDLRALATPTVEATPITEFVESTPAEIEVPLLGGTPDLAVPDIPVTAPGVAETVPLLEEVVTIEESSDTDISVPPLMSVDTPTGAREQTPESPAILVIEEPESTQVPPLTLPRMDDTALYAEWIAKGRQHLEAQRWDEAERAFAEAMLVPGYETDANARAGRQKARQRARIAAQTPKPKQLLDEGNRLQNSGQLGEAVVAYSKAIELQPENPVLWLSRADARARQGAYAESIVDYEKALALTNDPSVRSYTYNNLANVYYYSKTDFAKAVAYYKQAADMGNLAAMNSLGVCYGYGRGVETNLTRSLDWYRQAAESGYGLAMVNLGLAYQLGRGTDQDYARALRWFTRAAEAGISRAYVRMAIMYEQGLGVAPNPEKAAEYRARAKALGYTADG